MEWLLAGNYGTRCPACGYDLGVAAWEESTSSGRTCPSCGITFGVDDDHSPLIAYLQWRDGWIARRMPWSASHVRQPAAWDPVIQLHHIGVDLASSYAAWLTTLPPACTPEHLPYWQNKAAQRLAEIGARPVAIEALWDGDTTGWFVVLCALTPEPSPQHPAYTSTNLVSLRGPEGDIRLFNGTVPPWPEAQMAAEIGQALAQQYAVSYYFPSPAEPNDQAPRWWDTIERGDS